VITFHKGGHFQAKAQNSQQNQAKFKGKRGAGRKQGTPGEEKTEDRGNGKELRANVWAFNEDKKLK
jgi:hypothetical protein